MMEEVLVSNVMIILKKDIIRMITGTGIDQMGSMLHMMKLDEQEIIRKNVRKSKESVGRSILDRIQQVKSIMVYQKSFQIGLMIKSENWM